MIAIQIRWRWQNVKNTKKLHICIRVSQIFKTLNTILKILISYQPKKFIYILGFRTFPTEIWKIILWHKLDWDDFLWFSHKALMPTHIYFISIVMRKFHQCYVWHCSPNMFSNTATNFESHDVEYVKFRKAERKLHKRKTLYSTRVIQLAWMKLKYIHRQTFNIRCIKPPN